MRLITIVPALLVIVAGVSRAEAASWSGNADLLVGMKYAEKEDFGDANDLEEAGIQTDFMRSDWRFRPAINLLMSRAEDDATNTETNIYELQIGVRWYWKPWDMVRVSIGGGFELTAVTQDVGGNEVDKDTDFGVWIAASAQFVFAEHFHIGPQIGLSGSKAEIAGNDVNIGGAHFSLLAGYHF